MLHGFCLWGREIQRKENQWCGFQNRTENLWCQIELDSFRTMRETIQWLSCGRVKRRKASKKRISKDSWWEEVNDILKFVELQEGSEARQNVNLEKIWKNWRVYGSRKVLKWGGSEEKLQ